MFEAEARSMSVFYYKTTDIALQATVNTLLTCILMVATPMPSCREPTIIVGFL